MGQPAAATGALEEAGLGWNLGVLSRQRPLERRCGPSGSELRERRELGEWAPALWGQKRPVGREGAAAELSERPGACGALGKCVENVFHEGGRDQLLERLPEVCVMSHQLITFPV